MFIMRQVKKTVIQNMTSLIPDAAIDAAKPPTLSVEACVEIGI
jgi:hypothetical protein